MRKTLTEIAKLVEGEIVGDGKLVITGLCGIKEAKVGDLTFVANPKYFPLVEKTNASAIIAPRGIRAEGKSLIVADNPSLAFAKLTSLVVNKETHQQKGIHKTALINKTAKIGKNVSVGPYAVIEAGVKIGDNSHIHSGVFIGHQTTIGKGCILHSHATIKERIIIGDRVIIHSGTVIGSDGFGYVDTQGVHEKIPQIGTVVIEDDVEIGSNVTIDRARFDKTFIGRGTKIDNLVQIAHNVIIEENCIIVSQVGISGSVTVKKKAILAGQAGIAGHLTIGEGAIVAAQSGVTKSVAAHMMVSGYPAKPHETAKKVNAHVQRLPHYVDTLEELRKRVEALEAKLNNKNKS